MSEEDIIKEKFHDLNINKDNDNNNNIQIPENDNIKIILLRNINIMENIIKENDSFDDLIISYLIKDENKRIKNDFNFENFWLLITKICESWNTRELLGFESPISKEELLSLFEDICKSNDNNKNNNNENLDNEKNYYSDCDSKVLNINQIKPIILIIFENIILGYKKIIENF
jgi:hypothetical protein